MDNYANSKVTINCYNVYGRSARRMCNDDRDRQKKIYKEEYKTNKLNDNEKQLLKLYEKQHVSSQIFQYAIVGYVVLLIGLIITVNLPIWYWFI